MRSSLTKSMWRKEQSWKKIFWSDQATYTTMKVREDICKKKIPSQLYNQKYFWYMIKDISYLTRNSYSLVKWQRNPWEITEDANSPLRDQPCTHHTAWCYLQMQNAYFYSLGRHAKCWLEKKKKQFWSYGNRKISRVFQERWQHGAMSLVQPCQARSNLWSESPRHWTKETQTTCQGWNKTSIAKLNWKRHKHTEHAYTE